MKTVMGVFIVVVWGLCGCAGTKPEASKPPAMALGWVQRSVLDQPEYHQFKATYDTVQPEQDFIEMIPKVDQDIDVTVFFGTWCSDSQREVPRFLKIVDETGIASDRIRLYGVDRTKKSADGLTEQFKIERVPTFIFMKHGVEVGRITEKPHTVLEADMVSILADAQSK